MSLFDDELRKAQQFRAQLNARSQAEQAANDYNEKLAAAEVAQKLQGQGGLGGVLAGIGQSIGNLGKGLAGVFGTGGAAVGDLISSIATGKATTKNQDDFQKWLAGSDDIKDARIKNAGAAIDAASTLTDFIPGVGAGTKVALNVGQGITSGAAQQLIDKGSSATLEDIAKGAAIGGAAAGAGQAVGGVMAKRAANKPATSLLGRAAQSGIGRGAITGATSGAVGGGLATAINGGDLGQTLSGAIQGAQGGALGGATTAAAYGLAGKAVDNLRNRVEGAPETAIAKAPITDQTAEDIPEATKRRQTATGWDGEKIDASKRNAIQKIGKAIEDTGRLTENADVYGRLNNNTAERVKRNDTLNTLKKKYGYTSSDYDKAANLSEATNAWIANEAKTSGASGYDIDLVNRVVLSDDLAPMVTDKNAKTYRTKTQQLLQKAKVPGGGVDEYSAAGLYDAADKASKLSNMYYEKSHNKMDGSVTNAELSALADAYSNFKNQARAAADNMLGGTIDDVTRTNLTKMLKDSGAPAEAVKTLSKAKSLSELKSMTSPLEEARNIVNQIEQSQLKRGATTDNSTSVTNKTLKAAGAAQALETAAKPLGQAVGKAEAKLGRFVSKVGDTIAGDADNMTSKTIGKVKGVVNAANEGLNVGDADYGFSKGAQAPLTFGDLATRQIARQAGRIAANDVETANTKAAAQAALNEAQTNYNNALANYQTIEAQAQQQNVPGMDQLDRISQAMQAALAAGDIKAYGQLADLYKEAYNIYGPAIEAAQTQTTATPKALTATQSKALTGLQQLETLANMTPDVGTALANSPLGFLVNMTGGNDYANQAQSLALTLGYLQSGANITPREAENIGKSYVPSAYDSEQVRQQKLARARQLLQNYLGDTSALENA